jgi:hypothetical protein
MKPHDDQSEKTSRRHFVRTVATTLVAAPVISSLSACSQPPAPTPTTTTGTPTPTTPTTDITAQKGPFIITGNRPPVIIDGGSLHISSAVKLKYDTTGPTARRYKHTQVEGDIAYPDTYGHATKVRVINDYGDYPYLCDEEVRGRELVVNIWLQKGVRNADGTITYDPIPIEPHFVLRDTPGSDPSSFVIEYPETIGGTIEEQMKGAKVRAKYGKLGVTGRPFRIGQVHVLLAGDTCYDSQPPSDQNKVAENGFRILIDFTELSDIRSASPTPSSATTKSTPATKSTPPIPSPSR